ncbi:hypothetical protein HPB52_011924 [Rhipicephalus sanguineus]|uniref:CCHC-type domain-containing protein n=1 Tax=Rhipicephalus sanguineus TaxID=34632 RepID=A0A9D4PSP6_RHISA|nr:hypothetical protein HPB52_011924 [Rhipicephalus sanguineus]
MDNSWTTHGNTHNVIVLFDGFYVPRYVYYGAMLVRCSLYRKHIDVCYGCGRLGHRADVCPNPNNKMCRGCSYSNPPQEHLCDPKCQLCGKGHLTGDRKCKAKYKIPYLVKRRQWERRTREEDAAVEAYGNGYNSSSTANYASQDRHLRREGRSASRGAIGGAGKSRSRSSARSRSRSLTGSRASKPRSKSEMRVAAGPGAMQPTGFEVSWADVAASPGGDGAAGRRDGVVVSGGGAPGPGRPVPVEVNTADDSSVETADEREDRPVSSKKAALDPERPTTEPRSTSYERLKKRIENIETSLDERFASQTEQINKLFTVVNNSVAKLAEQMTQAIAALTARMDDFEARPPPLAGRPLRATGKPRETAAAANSDNRRRKRSTNSRVYRATGYINTHASRWLYATKNTHALDNIHNSTRSGSGTAGETNDPVKLAGYKAIDADASSEGQRQRRRRVASTGVMATSPAAAVLVRRNLTVAQRKARGRRLRLVEWDAFRKTRKERERRDRPITNIDEWTETLRADVDAATHEVPPEANLQVIDSRLLHMWEAKQALLKRWKCQRHNRTLRRRIAKLDRDTEEHAFQVCRAQWEETCNGLETQMRGASAWRLFRHLLDPEETKTAQGHKIRRLVRDFGCTPDEFLEAAPVASEQTAKMPEMVTVEGMDINPDDFDGAGWTTALGARRKRDPAKNAAAPAAAKTTANTAQKDDFNARSRSTVQKVVAASRLPRLPKDQIKVIVRPRGGLDVSKADLVLLARALTMAAALTDQEASEDTICVPEFS